MRSSRRRIFSLLIAVLGLSLSLSSRCWAQKPSRGALAPVSAIGLLGGYASLAHDHHAVVGMSLAHRRGALALQLEGSLRLRMIDEAPKDGRAARGLRGLDWDEPSEWARWLRQLDYGRRGDPLYLHLGELSGATLGHGTVVDAYQNVLASDHHRTGMRFDYDRGLWGLQLLSNDIVTWEITAARAFLRPLDGLRSALARSLTLGLSFALDRAAPSAVQLDASGALEFDSHDLPRGDRCPLSLFGVDLGLELWRSSLLALVPYLDLNAVPTGGRLDGGLAAGLHLALWPSAKGLRIALDYQWRLERGAWWSAGVGPMYEIERWAQASPGSAQVHATRLSWLRELGAQGDSRRSHLARLDIELPRALRIAARYEHREGLPLDNATLLLRLPPTREVQIGVFAAWWPEAKGGDHALLAAASLRWDFMRPFFARFEYHRTWHVIGEQERRFGVTDDMAFGLGVLSTF